MKGLRWVSLLLAMCLLLNLLLAAIAEEAVSGAVDAEVFEQDDVMLGALEEALDVGPGQDGFDISAYEDDDDYDKDDENRPEFEIDDSGALIRYNGPGGEVTIPGNVIDIYDDAFYNNIDQITGLIIPGSVEWIEDGTFAFSNNLKTVVINEGLKFIGENAFSDCGALEQVTLPASVTYIESNAFSGCPKLVIYAPGGSEAEAYAEEEEIPFVATSIANPTSITLSTTGTVDLQINKTLQPTVTLTPKSADKTIIWTVANNHVASVTNGVIKGTQTGTTTITATTVNGLTASFTLRVYNPNAKVKKLKFVVSGRVKKGGKLTLYAGEKLSVKSAVETEPYGAKAKLTWKSSNSKVASVDKNGKITAQKAGSADITVTSGKAKATLKVTVARNKVDNINKKPKLSSIRANSHEIFLKSVEIVSPKKVVAEYYLVYTYPPGWRTTYFSWVEDDLGVWDDEIWDRIRIASGTVKNIKVSTRGQSVVVFKVAFTGKQIKNTNIILKNYKNNMRNDEAYYLNWVF